jgi:hypothetical protein
MVRTKAATLYGVVLMERAYQIPDGEGNVFSLAPWTYLNVLFRFQGMEEQDEPALCHGGLRVALFGKDNLRQIDTG